MQAKQQVGNAQGDNYGNECKQVLCFAHLTNPEFTL
jgi:hypothetical protein